MTAGFPCTVFLYLNENFKYTLESHIFDI